MLDFFRDCTALITGASSGLGMEFAQQLAPYARRLVLVARRLERLEALRGELMAAHPGLEVFPYGIDLSDEPRLDELLRWLDAQGLRVTVLINNAGLGDYGPFETSDWARVRQMLAVNIAALTRLTHALLPGLRAARGAVLNVGSIAGMLPLPHEAVYGATKAYVASFSEALRAELRGSGVRITNVCPGPVETEFSAVARRAPHGLIATPRAFLVPPDLVVREALEAVAADRARVIPGWVPLLLVGVAAALPLCVLRAVLNRLASRPASA